MIEKHDAKEIRSELVAQQSPFQVKGTRVPRKRPPRPRRIRVRQRTLPAFRPATPHATLEPKARSVTAGSLRLRVRAW